MTQDAIFLAPPEGFRIQKMADPVRGSDYSLLLRQSDSSYDNWVATLGGPDGNADLIMAILAGDGTLLDVGANIGTIAIPVSKAGSKVICVELNPENCLRLWFGGVVSRLKDFHVLQVAAGNMDGMVRFKGDEAWGAVSIDADAVPVVSLRVDTLLAPHGLTSADNLVIKIDVEGYEFPVLQGALQTLAQLRPIVIFESIQIEGNGNKAPIATRQLIADQGYDLYLLRDKILSPKSPEDYQEGLVSDFVAIPKGKAFDVGSVGYECRPLTDQESIAWINEMLLSQEPHQRHAAGVLLRWKTEQPERLKLSHEVVAGLAQLDHLADMKPQLLALLEVA